MNQANVKVSFYLKKSEADADGNCPVMAKLNVGKYSEAAFSVKMKVPQSRWTSGRATGKSVAAKEINNRLDEIRAMALNIYTEQSAVRDGVTADEVKGVLLGMASGQETLLGYFKRFISNFEKRVGVNRTIGSLRAYRNAYNHIERFLQVQYKLSDIPFSALDRSFIDKYDLYLRTERNLTPGTIINLTVQLKTIIGEAIADGIITASPFLGYEPVRPKAVQKYLTAEELHRIMTTPLHRQTQKTKIEFEIPLLDLPLQILKKYGDTAPGDKLLPVYCNSMLNLYLKEIARICHIDRPLVFHQARHTYATEITLSHGVPLETVSKMLGHSQIETTQIYAKVTDDKIDADTKALNRKISERFSVII